MWPLDVIVQTLVVHRFKAHLNSFDEYDLCILNIDLPNTAGSAHNNLSAIDIFVLVQH